MSEENLKNSINKIVKDIIDDAEKVIICPVCEKFIECGSFLCECCDRWICDNCRGNEEVLLMCIECEKNIIDLKNEGYAEGDIE